MAEAIWWHVRRMVPAALAAIYVPDDRSRELVLRHASGTGADRVEGLRIGVGQGVSGWVADNGATLTSSYPALDLGTRLGDVVPPLESALSTPLVTGSRTVGVLTFYAGGQSFSSSDRRLVELVAAVIADPVARALEYEQGREATWKDGRTGLPNAWALARLLTSRALGAMPDRSFGLLCFAVDGQSGVSMAPDVALATFAAASRPVLRSGDLLLRHGENELVILLPDTRRQATAGVAGRILAALEGTAAQGLAPSVGLACAPADGRTIDELLLKAHACMEQGSASVRAAQA